MSTPRPRRVPKTRAAQAKADALAELFQPAPVVLDPEAESIPFDTRLNAWFERNDWQPFPFQREVWGAIQGGASGLLHATTGAGKTWAVWLGALAAYGREQKSPAPLTVLWITPMRALAADTARALQTAVTGLAVPWSIGLRTGDTQSAERARQNKRMPSALVTTPESLTLMLTRANAIDEMKHVRLVVVDEWHELLGNKRGTQTQLALARLAHWRPRLQVWGLSATLGNLELAEDALLAPVKTPRVAVRGAQPKTLIVDTLIPDTIERFPWGGHLGVRQVEPVAAEIDKARSSLVFTNTRSQSEIWYRALLELRPDWAGLIALHHGSLDKEVREWVELGLKNGQLKAVVCTSSLDLGVDFLPVDRVFQIGSPKGVARLMQRAGRSGHAPGRASRVTIVPTHALELVEAAAARWAVEERHIEGREMPYKPLDVLVQHLVSIAIGGGFTAPDLFDEVRTTYAYRDLTQQEFDWALAFVERGGASLAAYPDFHRVMPGADGVYRVPREDLIRRHRNNVGTIVANATINVAYMTGGRIGAMEESFISRLKPGDVFTFGGRALELILVRDMTAYVKRATSSRGAMPQWAGSRMPLSSELAEATLMMLARAVNGVYDEPEMQAVRPLLELQAKWSALPEPGVLLVEMIRSREGHHLFCYPFAGRMAHIGLGSLIGWRVARDQPSTFSISMNDYGFELLSARPFDWETLIQEGLFSPDNLEHDILASLNSSELAARRFREIARVSGLIFQGHPGQQKSARQLQASSGLFYEVFRRHDSDNLLLAQAEEEVMLQELELERMRAALQSMSTSRLALTHPKKPTPFAFPLIIARLREKVSTEKLSDRVARMLADLEKGGARMMIEALTVDAGGHALVLSAARAAFDPVLKTLFIADAHFGKDAVFRARGIPVPEGSTAETLARLDALISMHRPVSVIFLGDLLHAKESHALATLRALAEWRSRHAALRLVLVEGNHDRHAGGPPDMLKMEVVDEPYRLGPWALCHYPQRVAGAFALAGHEHPVYRVATRRDSVRLPCFRFAADAGVLPAFGAFTGGYEVNENARNERIFVVAGERVMPVRPQAQAQ